MPPPAPPVPLTLWPSARRWLAAAALAAAVVTSLVGAALAGPTAGWFALGHVVAAAWALTDRRIVVGQVGAGVALAWSLVPGTDDPVAGVVVVVAGVVATSELLGSTHRLGMVVERDPRPELLRAALATGAAVVLSAVTVAASALPGPSGAVATGVATLGCVVAAVALRQTARAGAAGAERADAQR